MSLQIFAPPFKDKHSQEEGEIFAPRFDENGLISAIACDFATNEVLMLAYMNKEALELTLSTGIAHYWSRSRQSLWKKGETSGNMQHIKEILVDCDQDAILLKVEVEGHGPTCHTGRNSCFYRSVKSDNGQTTLKKII